MTEELSSEQDMKTSQNNEQDGLDEVEDLTLFADESFNTDDVDLFEFTGEDNSPLTRLKSIILSLDWEISEDILQELSEEIDDLQQMWQEDKIASVYLQGLKKIGDYLRTEGAYAHPNAIKLLLTLFYNFEKIISSQDITGETISSLVKTDVRKFKILQYQINQTKSTTVTTPQETLADVATDGVDKVKETPTIECEPLICLKATILGLEWEVTDKVLDQFNAQIADVREHFMDNKPAQVLIQGLQALGGYISDEGSAAHPEAFTMLHSFYEGLEAILEDKTLGPEESQNILIERVSGLNNLKALIAASTGSSSQSTADEIVDEFITAIDIEEEDTQEEELIIEETAPKLDDTVEDELSFDFVDSDEEEKATAAMETADMAYPDDILDPSAIQPVDIEAADDFIEDELSIGTEISPALTASSEGEPFVAETADKGIEEELDLFFADDEQEDYKSLNLDEQIAPEETDELSLSFSDEDISTEESILAETSASDVPGSTPDRTDTVQATEEKLFFDDEEEEKQTTITPALIDSAEERGFDEKDTVATLTQEPTDDIDDKLNAFFGDLDDTEPLTSETEELPEEEEISITPALEQSDEDIGFQEENVAATLAEEPSGELDEKLDAFFGDLDDTEPLAPEAVELPEEEEISISPALEQSDEDIGFQEENVAATLAEEPSGEIDDKLDTFFGDLDETEPLTPEAEEEAAVTEKDRVVSSPLQLLGTSLTALATKCTVDQITESKAFVQQLQKTEEQTNEQVILLQLLDSVLTLLPDQETLLPEETTEVTTYLYEQLQQDTVSPDVLITAIRRYTDWQKNLIQNLLDARPQNTDVQQVDEPVDTGDVATEIRAGFNDLRSILTAEFSSLHRELTPKKE